LKDLQRAQPKNVFVLQLLKQAYVELCDWYNLRDLIPLLRKYHWLEKILFPLYR